MLFTFAPDWSEFPRLANGEKSRREVVARATDKKHIDFISRSYQSHSDVMDNYACVYFVGPEHDEVCKIGLAKNPFKRLMSLQSGHWERYLIRGLFWFPNYDHAASAEYHALAEAARHGLRLLGEWVDLDHAEAMGLLLSIWGDRPITDSYGLVHDWFPIVQRQRVEQEKQFYERSSQKTKEYFDALATARASKPVSA